MNTHATPILLLADGTVVILPADGEAGQVLSTNADGTFAWVDLPAGGGATDHAELDNLDYANSGHTGFAQTVGSNSFDGAQQIFSPDDGSAALTLSMAEFDTGLALDVRRNGTQVAKLDHYGSLTTGSYRTTSGGTISHSSAIGWSLNGSLNLPETSSVKAAELKASSAITYDSKSLLLRAGDGLGSASGVHGGDLRLRVGGGVNGGNKGKVLFQSSDGLVNFGVLDSSGNLDLLESGTNRSVKISPGNGAIDSANATLNLNRFTDRPVGIGTSGGAKIRAGRNASNPFTSPYFEVGDSANIPQFNIEFTPGTQTEPVFAVSADGEPLGGRISFWPEGRANFASYVAIGQSGPPSPANGTAVWWTASGSGTKDSVAYAAGDVLVTSVNSSGASNTKKWLAHTGVNGQQGGGSL